MAKASSTESLTSTLVFGILTQLGGGALYVVADAEELDALRYVAVMLLAVGGLMTFIGAVGWAVFLGMQAHAKSGR